MWERGTRRKASEDGPSGFPLFPRLQPSLYIPLLRCQGSFAEATLDRWAVCAHPSLLPFLPEPALPSLAMPSCAQSGTCFGSGQWGRWYGESFLRLPANSWASRHPAFWGWACRFTPPPFAACLVREETTLKEKWLSFFPGVCVQA